MAGTLVYWSVWAVIAVLAAGVSVHGHDGQALSETLPVMFSSFAAPDPARAVLLGVGIMAMAFTYRQAWQSWRRK